jgi:hypothetical protein
MKYEVRSVLTAENYDKLERIKSSENGVINVNKK